MFEDITYTELLTTVKYKPRLQKDKQRMIHDDTVTTCYLVPFALEKLLGKLPHELHQEELCYPAELEAIQILNNDLKMLQARN